MEFEDQYDQEEEMGLRQQVDYESPSPPPPHKRAPSPEMVGTGGMTGTTTLGPIRSVRPRYRECLKNQAVGIGGHAVDGCGEFMAAGEDGTLDSLKCAACGCHRNFHRKETDPQLGPPQPPPPPPHAGYYRLPPPSGFLNQRPPSPLQLALPPPPQIRESGGEECYQEDAGASGGGGGCRKRFRTKFTAEQKEKMLGLAERIGWRIQKQDEEIVQRFCEETGVKRQVLKVWLHNNKNTLGKRPPQQTQD